VSSPAEVAPSSAERQARGKLTGIIGSKITLRLDAAVRRAGVPLRRLIEKPWNVKLASRRKFREPNFKGFVHDDRRSYYVKLRGRGMTAGNLSASRRVCIKTRLSVDINHGTCRCDSFDTETSYFCTLPRFSRAR